MTTNKPTGSPGEPTPETPGYLLIRRWVLRVLVTGIAFGFTAFAIISLWILQIVNDFHNNAVNDRRDIACTFVQPYPDSAGPGVAALRAKYNCPLYKAPPTPITPPRTTRRTP